MASGRIPASQRRRCKPQQAKEFDQALSLRREVLPFRPLTFQPCSTVTRASAGAGCSSGGGCWGVPAGIPAAEGVQRVSVARR